MISLPRITCPSQEASTRQRTVMGAAVSRAVKESWDLNTGEGARILLLSGGNGSRAGFSTSILPVSTWNMLYQVGQIKRYTGACHNMAFHHTAPGLEMAANC